MEMARAVVYRMAMENFALYLLDMPRRTKTLKNKNSTTIMKIS